MFSFITLRKILPIRMAFRRILLWFDPKDNLPPPAPHTLFSVNDRKAFFTNLLREQKLDTKPTQLRKPSIANENL